jgi:hypothetical protein
MESIQRLFGIADVKVVNVEIIPSEEIRRTLVEPSVKYTLPLLSP